MSGAIMPEPLAIPAMETVRPSTSTCAPAPLGKVSVVMIARAAASQPPGARASVSVSSRARMRSCGQRLADHAGGGGEDAARGKPRRLGHCAGQGVHRGRAGLRAGEGIGVARVDEEGRAGPVVPGDLRLAVEDRRGARRERVNTPATVVPGARRTSITSSRPA